MSQERPGRFPLVRACFLPYAVPQNRWHPRCRERPHPHASLHPRTPVREEKRGWRVMHQPLGVSRESRRYSKPPTDSEPIPLGAPGTRSPGVCCVARVRAVPNRSSLRVYAAHGRVANTPSLAGMTKRVPRSSRTKLFAHPWVRLSLRPHTMGVHSLVPAPRHLHLPDGPVACVLVFPVGSPLWGSWVADVRCRDLPGRDVGKTYQRVSRVEL